MYPARKVKTMTEPIVIKVATDPDYWGQVAPTDENWAELEDCILYVAEKRGVEVIIERVPENFSNGNLNEGEAWDILDEAWWKFIY